MQRSYGSETACSRCSTPSGIVPGGGAVAVLGSDLDAVEKELVVILVLIAFLLLVLGSSLHLLRAKLYFLFSLRSFL